MHWIRTGVVLAFIGVLLGTFGAHGLPELLQKIIQKDHMRTIGGIQVPYITNYIEVFNTGVKYQFYHALTLMFLGLYSMHHKHKLLNIAGHSFLWGTILFSGSIYLMVSTYTKPLGMITPIGGILFIVGWICLIIAVCAPQKQSETLESKIK